MKFAIDAINRNDSESGNTLKDISLTADAKAKEQGTVFSKENVLGNNKLCRVNTDKIRGIDDLKVLFKHFKMKMGLNEMKAEGIEHLAEPMSEEETRAFMTDMSKKGLLNNRAL